MRTQTIYTYAELKELDPDAAQKALSQWEDRLIYEIDWMHETIASLKELIKALDFTLKDWSLGAYHYGSFIRVSIPGDLKNLTGKKALNYVKSCVNIKGNCELTGCSMDNDYIENLIKNIKSGDTLEEAVTGLAQTCTNILEAEEDYMRSEDTLEDADWVEFYGDGTML